VPFEHARDAAVVVLIDDEHAKIAVRLAFERFEQAPELIDPVDGRDDKVESHGRTLTAVPLVSAVVAVHNDGKHIRSAVDSVLQQTVGDLELIVVDDASTDDTRDVLAGVDDARLSVVTNDVQLGLAGSLNRGLERAEGRSEGRYIARLDSDDVALTDWLECLLACMREAPVAVLGTGIVELDVQGRPGPVHRLPSGPLPVRWHALFSAPFFHSTVLVDREVLDRHGLRYDTHYAESEDYDLWTRLLGVADGDNLPDPLVLRRMHPAQAQARRGGLQRAFQREIALREIERLAPGLPDAELAWRLGIGLERGARAADAYVALLECFEELHGTSPAVRQAAARALVRGGSWRHALRLAPTAPARVVGERIRRRSQDRRARRRLVEAEPVRVAVVSPEPTPYRAPLFDLIGAREEVDLTVIYAAETVAARTWSVDLQHCHVFLRGVRVPGARRLLRHDYPVTPGVARALREAAPAVVVVSGWSTFAAQAAIAWARTHRIPYVLHVESHDLERRPWWRRAVKDAAASRIIRGAASVLVVGSAARESVVARGADPARVRVFANTIDVDHWIERADNLSSPLHDGVVVLSVGRDVPEKGFDVLAAACAEAGVRLEAVTGGVEEDELARRYVNADVFALLSRHEPWGVVVNEAAASGLPLVLSDRVGAARDLLRDGESGFVVPADDIGAAAAALRRLADDPALRRSMGARSRELVRGWGYGPSVEGFVAAVREATSR
jgi:glycosyltransferase involved in cell wall biosynthesis